MIKASEVLGHQHSYDETLTLPYELRQKSRLKATLDNGSEIGLMLPRGTILRGGDAIKAEDGTVIMIKAAEETVSSAEINDATLFARACYHLGNRHVPLQINNNSIRYLHDHVLDDMLAGLGVQTICQQATFEPESGAYGGGHHHHSH